MRAVSGRGSDTIQVAVALLLDRGGGGSYDAVSSKSVLRLRRRILTRL